MALGYPDFSELDWVCPKDVSRDAFHGTLIPTIVKVKDNNIIAILVSFISINYALHNRIYVCS